MPEDDAKSDRPMGRPAGRGGPIRTAPLEDSNKLRDAVQSELAKRVAPSVVVLSGPDVGLRVRLDRSIDIGRDPTVAFALRDESVSWRHARIEDRGSGAWAVVDLGSTNGTLLNGERAQDTVLGHGDRIFIGKSVLEFQLADALREGFNAELDRLLYEDDLSGLLLKRRFDAQLESSVAAVLAGALPVLSVIVMDLDGVKSINDTHGHAMGAHVIGEAGHVIGAGLPERAFATRFGGDEYAVGAPGLSKSQAVDLAEGLRNAIVSHVYERGGTRVYPGVSCGVASLPEDAHDAAGVFKAADEAMYRAKRAGKNRVLT